MLEPKKVFSIERKRLGTQPRTMALGVPSNSQGTQGLATTQDLQKIMDFMVSLEKKIETTSTLSAADQKKYDEHLAKINNIEGEVAEISGKIRATKAEIAALRHPLATDDKFDSATSELGAIVQQTESATENIMDAAERIEDATSELMTRKLDVSANAIVGEIIDEVTKVYEACNFQDLTGQRITKVVKVLNFIEERVDNMMSAWDIKEFETMPLPPEVVQKDGDLDLHGPAEASVDNNISQDEIDRLFD